MTCAQTDQGPTACPCGRGDIYADCCGRLHAGLGTAPTAEHLMRARYSAFARGDTAYLLATWHPSTRPGALVLDDDRRWTGLEIVDVAGGGPFDAVGTVEFVARSVLAGAREVQSERSRFVREDRRWFYVDGQVAG